MEDNELTRYSPIEEISVENYQRVEEVHVDFSESPIVAFVGPNDAGKSSTITAIRNLLYNDNNSRCKRHIRRKQKGFLTQLRLKDGYTIMRLKAANGSLNGYRLFREDTLVDKDDKISSSENGLVPPYVTDKLGVVIEPETKEALNIRTYKSLLLFSLTSDSDNYRVMYNALKVGNINKAISIGKEEAAELKSSIKSNKEAIKNLQARIKGIVIVDTSPVVATKEKIGSMLDTASKLDSLVQAVREMRRLEDETNAIDMLSKLEEINIMTVSNICSALQMSNEMKKLTSELGGTEKLTDMEPIDSDIFVRLQKVTSEVAKEKLLEAELVNEEELFNHSEISERVVEHFNVVLAGVAKLRELEKSTMRKEDMDWLESAQLSNGEDILGRISKILAMTNDIASNEVELQEIDRNYQEALQELSKYGTYSAEVGGFVKKCPNCGDTVIVTLDEMMQVTERG